MTIIVTIPVLKGGTDLRVVTALMLAIVVGVILDFWLTRIYSRKRIAVYELAARAQKGEITKEEYLEKKKSLLGGFT